MSESETTETPGPGPGSETETEVNVKQNGPYRVDGPLVLKDSDGNPWLDLPEGKSVSLCRCGHSGHKPFCDGTHNKEDFESAPTPESQPYPW